MHFYEICHTSVIRDKRLELPKEFTVKYGKKLSDNAIIKVPHGIWHIGLRKDEGVISFENGWPEFMEFYSICVGHVMFFRYDGNSEFQLHIFGKDATEIDYPCHNNDNANHKDEMTSTHSDDDEVEVVSIHSGSTQSNYEPSMTSESSLNQNAKPAGHKFPQESRKQRTVVPTRLFHSKAFQATLKAADEFRSENPFYKLTMQASYIKANVRVPNDFADSYLRNKTQTKITLGIPDGRTWEVEYVLRTPTERRLSRGWYRFVADNHLKEGDVCVFELVDREKIQMNVHIFRLQKRFVTPEMKNYAAGFQATLEAAKGFTSENPFFKVVMHTAYINGGMVTVPAVFATSHLTNIKQMMITLRVSDGRTWEVVYVSQTPTNGRISQGWAEFVADNDLKEGDVCVFELVDRRKNFEMNVYIFRLKYSID
ncbi:hypothetical protein C5167_000814 [Papaver somniferum]|uniref:TF-B3 domain-containing protein n=1 Tax=Papaver somniferum TaxID=3469 RepID=A0A4Y7KXL0_PAPSO|nr:B3 domain-containing transcription factor VRN1-like [Papaver somniferum]RZC76665.1 hypothetical protein C5167_000814 [Papaver somniferum]